jgi:hypothetical protein
MVVPVITKILLMVRYRLIDVAVVVVLSLRLKTLSPTTLEGPVAMPLRG